MFSMSAWVLSEYSGFSPQLKDMDCGRIGDSKLHIDVTGCLSLCISSGAECQLVQGVPCLLPSDSWDRLQPSRDPELDKWQKMNGTLFLF